MRRVLRGALIGALVVLGLCAAAAVVLVGPHLRADWLLDRGVRAAAADWRDFGPDQGRERLAFETARAGLANPDEHCLFDEQPQTLTIRCAWTAVLIVPGTEGRLPLSFHSVGSVERVEMPPIWGAGQ